MKNQYKSIKTVTTFLAMLIFVTPFAWAAKPVAGDGTTTQVYDTSFAVEFSYSCLEGGCHETNQKLVDEYTASPMTHRMVKCNTCHGTHTVETVGAEKPNLTGYYPGIGATGYVVGNDRCKTCHNNQHTTGKKASNDCVRCHAPHVFLK